MEELHGHNLCLYPVSSVFFSSTLAAVDTLMPSMQMRCTLQLVEDKQAIGAHPFVAKELYCASQRKAHIPLLALRILLRTDGRTYIVLFHPAKSSLWPRREIALQFIARRLLAHNHTIESQPYLQWRCTSYCSVS